MKRFGLLALVLFLSATASYAQVDRDIEALVDAYHAADRFDGSVLVSDGGTVVYSGGVGLANAQWGVPNAADTRFRIGSVTKQFTAALVLQLMEEGRVDLQAPVTTYVPTYPADPGDRITVHHLLTHTAGIPNYTNLPQFDEQSRDPFTPDEFVATFQDLPLEFEPGAQWAYSNSGYFLLGVLVEKVTGQPYAQALHQRLLAPLGMTDSAYGDYETVFPRAASGYRRDADGLRNAPYLDTSTPYAAGMMLSTVGDLRTWSDALVANRVFQRPETLALMNTPHADVPGADGLHYGYGVFSRTVQVGGEDVAVIEHGGGIPGFATSFWRLVDRDAVIVAISNTNDGSGPLVRGLIGILYGESARAPLPSAVASVRAALASGGVAAATTAFESARLGDAYETTEGDLNTIGYEALGRGEVETAVALFRLNAATYPEAWNPHDSLGEALLAAGDTSGAEASYRRALELNPAAASAQAALASMGAETPDAVTVSEAVLDQYVGVYQIVPGMTLTVTRDGTRLFAEATGQGTTELLPVSDTEFSVVDVDARIVFEAGEPAPALTLFQAGQEIRSPRVE